MANAIVLINRRAKSLQRSHKSWTWRYCIEKASQEYRSKHHKKKASPKKRRVGSAAGKKKGTRVKIIPSGQPRFGIPKHQHSVTGIKKVGTHHLTAELKNRLKEKLDFLILRRYHASTKRDKRKIQKRIVEVNRQMKKLS